MWDGTKDMSQRSRIYNKQEREYSGNKGHGKTHLLATDLFGKVCYLTPPHALWPAHPPISTLARTHSKAALARSHSLLTRPGPLALPPHPPLRAAARQPLTVVAGIQGNQNDRGGFKLTQQYNHPNEYMLPNHTGLFDGVFNGPEHVNTSEPGLLPFSAAQLNSAAPALKVQMRNFNRTQRRLRVVIEQTFGIIKQWGIVSNQPWRADVDVQGLNFILCTQLTTWLMESRETYPRGKKFMNAELEEWEELLSNWLDVDPLCPGIY
jgi:hypothetical protein